MNYSYIIGLIILTLLAVTPLRLGRRGSLRTLFGLFWTSQQRRAHRQRQTVWDFLFYQEGMFSAPSRKSKAVLPLGEPSNTRSSSSWKRERCTELREREREKGEDLYLQLKWLFSLYMVLKYFRLFRNKNPKLDIYLLTHRGTFLILKLNSRKEKKKSNLQMNVLSSHWENISALFNVKSDSLEKT